MVAILALPAATAAQADLEPVRDTTAIDDPLSECASHPPIHIAEDEGPLGFVWDDPVTGEHGPRPGSGVTGGSGTPEDPYTIEGWCIDAPGISLEDTKAHVVVRSNVVSGPGFLPDASAVFVEGSRNVSVTGNEIAGAGYGIGVWRSGDLLVDENLVQQNTEYGIWVAESDRLVIEKNTVRRNDQGIGIGFAHGAWVSQNEIVGNRVGVVNAFSDDAQIRDNRVAHGTDGVFVREASGVRAADNEVADHSGTGIAFDSSPGSVVVDNKVTNSGNEGIIMWASPDALVIGNTVAQSGFTDDRYGIRVAQSTSGTAVDNTVRENANGLVFDASLAGTLRGNTMVDNTGYGLMLWEAEEARVSTNTMTGNGIGVGVVDGSDGITLEGNNLFDNDGGQALDTGQASGSTVDASGNWWGCPDGPDHEACDQVAGDADYSDWLTKPHPDAP